ncbi:hypothetical protein [Sphingomonas xinjiangensis]|uniref:Uncharacterized protein n=1 Tax=Sphingomonas xinjiangensis TaxID=643568 RepID=A0A840YRL1_9SPHN|nr:hypothetical protein [Sphingomonas xinjiangensis]MBB5712352.1 hypothetical protein [Sphingomonas xinjiangensis]
MATAFDNRWFERRSARSNTVAAARGAPIDYRFMAYFMLHTMGFLVVTLLMTWGLFVLAFLAIGGFSIDGMMHHLANMSARYVAADPARIASFKTIIIVSHMLFAAGIAFFRRHSILPPVSSVAGGHAND